MDVLELRNFETLSPFEIKDELIKLAKKPSRTTQSAFLNAGRGNPNWIATTPREGYFLLGQFAITESKRVMEHPAGIGGKPPAPGIAGRFGARGAQPPPMPRGAVFFPMGAVSGKKNALVPGALPHRTRDTIPFGPHTL